MFNHQAPSQVSCQIPEAGSDASGRGWGMLPLWKRGKGLAELLTCVCFCLAAEQSPSPRMKKVQRFWEMPVLGNGNGNSITGFKNLGVNPWFMDYFGCSCWFLKWLFFCCLFPFSEYKTGKRRVKSFSSFHSLLFSGRGDTQRHGGIGGIGIGRGAPGG